MLTFEQFLDKYLKEKDEDAFIFVSLYVIYCHAIDDLIDEPQPDYNNLLDTFALAPVLFGNNFYVQHFHKLYPLVKMAHYAYKDSVKMEKSNEKWKQYLSDALRQQANEVIIEVINIVHGSVEIREEASMLLREIAYKTHHSADHVRI